jgi:hypothetical protein
MSKTTRWWLAAPLALGLIVAACNGDDEATPAPEAAEPSAAAEVTEEAPAEETSEETSEEAPAEDPAEAPAADGDDGEAAASIGTVTLDGEAISLTRMLCFFEEQPRAGLGGVFTHTAQGQGTDAAGEPVILDMSRARAEDGTVEDDVIVDIGDFTAEDAISLRASGPEGLVTFGEGSVSGDGIEVSDFGEDARVLTFDVPCS